MVKRIVSVVLLLIMVIPFAACKNNSDPPVPTSDTSATSTTIDKSEELNVPKKTYNGADFVVLSAGQVAYNDFNIDETADTIVNEAQYRRKATVENLFDIVIEEIIDENKSGVGNGSGYKRISKMIDSGDADYNVALIGGMDVSTLAYSDYLMPMSSTTYVDLSKPWWDQDANKDLSILGEIFFTQGDISAAKYEATYIIYYNKELGKEKLTEDPYTLVTDGKWTIDKLSEFCLNVSEDLDGNDVRDMEDMYGLYVWDDAILGMISAAGHKVASTDKDGKLELSIYNEDVLSVIQKFGTIAYNSEYAVMYQRYANAGDVVNHWLNDQALFWANSTLNLSKFREMQSDFGILPFPKLREEQDRYYSTMATYNSQFICFPRNQVDEEFSSAVTEALAYYGREILRPAVYERTITGTYFRDNESAGMLDLIFQSYIYDNGQLHRIGNLNNSILNMFRAKESNFTAIYESSRTLSEQQIDVVNENYQKIIDNWKNQ
ncbi:MAG: hypothetical protein SPJ23_05445 [Eubacteriales bacterium]|nr:hypothetical protein [Eubacteriales bacterium]